MYPGTDFFNDFFATTNTDDIMFAFALLYFGLMLVCLIWSIVAYVFQSVGFYTMAKRRGVHRPWLAWVPVANMWLLGSLSDQYQYVAKGNVHNRRKTLLGLMIALCATMVVLLVLAFVVGFVAGIHTATRQLAGGLVTMLLLLVLVYLALMALAITTAVFQYIALYDLFTSSRPACAVIFLVLGILFGGLLPFFIFACRNKDDGMPPRRTVTQIPE